MFYNWLMAVSSLLSATPDTSVQGGGETVDFLVFSVYV